MSPLCTELPTGSHDSVQREVSELRAVLASRDAELAALRGRLDGAVEHIRKLTETHTHADYRAALYFLAGATPTPGAPVAPIGEPTGEACQWGQVCTERGCPLKCARVSTQDWHPMNKCLCAYHLTHEPAAPPVPVPTPAPEPLCRSCATTARWHEGTKDPFEKSCVKCGYATQWRFPPTPAAVPGEYDLLRVHEGAEASRAVARWLARKATGKALDEMSDWAQDRYIEEARALLAPAAAPGGAPGVTPGERESEEDDARRMLADAEPPDMEYHREKWRKRRDRLLGIDTATRPCPTCGAVAIEVEAREREARAQAFRDVKREWDRLDDVHGDDATYMDAFDAWLDEALASTPAVVTKEGTP